MSFIPPPPRTPEGVPVVCETSGHPAVGQTAWSWGVTSHMGAAPLTVGCQGDTAVPPDPCPSKGTE
ncbi:hypothetical protein GCM10010302_10130 [Streptomyces polychromogenes]|uniref:Uncharacterized protein n=1 Tax=Streptomyces polychromogenes TaxID=67342 RepID=A0ABP3EU56_9ACTN